MRTPGAQGDDRNRIRPETRMSPHTTVINADGPAELSWICRAEDYPDSILTHFHVLTGPFRHPPLSQVMTTWVHIPTNPFALTSPTRHKTQTCSGNMPHVPGRVTPDLSHRTSTPMGLNAFLPLTSGHYICVGVYEGVLGGGGGKKVAAAAY
jgi:hypothetical protein